MTEAISIDECGKLHPEQWVMVYGISSNGREYINICQVNQLNTVVSDATRRWFENVVLEPVNEDGQSIAVENAFF